MIQVGTRYIKNEYNCADFVADWYREKLGVNIPVINEFSRSFVIWMRKNFADIDEPEDNCLVLMVNLDGSYHVGVYYDFGVWHNFKPSIGNGSVCKWTLGSVKHYYKKVSFHKWSK